MCEFLTLVIACPQSFQVFKIGSSCLLDWFLCVTGAMDVEEPEKGEEQKEEEQPTADGEIEDKENQEDALKGPDSPTCEVLCLSD